jgi:hypothetical protein
MTSERAPLNPRVTRPSASAGRRVARWLSGSLLLGLVALAASGSVACAEEEFQCCECFFPQCIDAMGTGVAQRPCSCTQAFSYEACGKFCEQDAPVSLFMQGFTSCGKASSSLAKDSCSIGNPVGAP